MRLPLFAALTTLVCPAAWSAPTDKSAGWGLAFTGMHVCCALLAPLFARSPSHCVPLCPLRCVLPTLLLALVPDLLAHYAVTDRFSLPLASGLTVEMWVQVHPRGPGQGTDPLSCRGTPPISLNLFSVSTLLAPGNNNTDCNGVTATMFPSSNAFWHAQLWYNLELAEWSMCSIFGFFDGEGCSDSPGPEGFHSSLPPPGALGAWHHVAVSANFSAQNMVQLLLYVDGILLPSSPPKPLCPSPLPPSLEAYLTLGAYGLSIPGDFEQRSLFSGVVDNVRCVCAGVFTVCLIYAH